MENFSAPDLIKRFETLRSDRTNWENYWQAVADYVLPEKAFITTTPSLEGDRLNVQIYDTTAVYAAGMLGAGLQGHLTSPAQKWFSLVFPNKSLMELEGVKSWLRESEDKIYQTLNASNFNHQSHEAYMDLITFGTCCLYEEEDVNAIVRFDARPIKEIFLVEDATGKVESVFRFFQLTVEQAYTLYGKDAGERVVTKFEKKEYDHKIDFLHVVGPRTVREVGKKDPANKPFFSKILAYEDKKFVKESGYDEMPLFTPRWEKNSAQRFGYSPAMKAYGDIRTANAIKKDLLDGAAKVVNPPIDAPHEGYLLPLDMRPGGINYRNVLNPDDRLHQLDIQPNIPVGKDMLEQERLNIKQHFFVDLFLMLERANMTATEVVTRNEEKMLLIGPVIGRLQNEFLDPIIFRTFSILSRRQIIGPAPDALKAYLAEHPEDDKYEVKYEGKLAKMQRYSEVKATLDFLGLVGQIAQAKPDVIDLVNDEEIVKQAQELFGINPKFLNDSETVKALRQARAQQQEMMAKLQMMQQAGAVAKDVGAADKSFSDAGAGGKAK